MVEPPAGGMPVHRDQDPAERPGSAAPLPLARNPGVEAPSVGEIMACALSRALRDDDVAIFGAVSLLPLAACRLAQLTHAPNLTMITGPSGGVNPAADPLVPSVGDYANLAGEAILDFPTALGLQAGGRVTVFFAGGLEIDAYGNANLLGTPAVRGPGAAGLPLSATVGRTILYTSRHDPRTFVPRVATVTLPGWVPDPAAGDSGPARATGGPVLVVTPLAVCDFAPSGRMRLVSLHSGVSAAAVQAATGFPLIMPDPVPVTPLPPRPVLRLLRELDRSGLLRQV